MSEPISNRNVKRVVMKLTFVLAIFLCALFVPHFAVAQCLEYDPKTVSLTGGLRQEVHPGPPNYESVKNGDRPETIWVLRLSKPICVAGTDDINVREDGQAEVQMVLEPDQFGKYKHMMRQQVIVTGKLFHAHTGHHHKTLLISVSEIKSAKA